MSAKAAKQKPDYLWQDRKHWAWFPFSFTRYAATRERLYVTKGFLSKTYDESLLYRITDITLRRSLGQRIFGTGTVELCLRGDHDGSIELKNIKHSRQTRQLLSELIEESRRKENVVGQEFYGTGHNHDGIGDRASHSSAPVHNHPQHSQPEHKH